jgi:hypothetical protein
MFQASLIGPLGPHFFKENKAAERPIISWAWAGGDRNSIEWSFKHGLDGILVDDFVEYDHVREHFGQQRMRHWTIRQLWSFFVLNVWIFIWGLVVTQRDRRRRLLAGV